MSDFLNKFSKKDYKDDHKPKIDETVSVIETVAEPVKTEMVSQSNTSEKTVIETKVQDIGIKPKLRASHQEPEEVHIDPSYRRNQRNKLIYGTIAVVLFLVISFGIYYLINQVQVPDYINKPLSELKTWASRNNIALETETVFSLDVSKDYIIEMDPLANSNIQKGSILRVIVSNGADPDELISVPDFTGNSYGQIQEWLSTNKINNLRINYENNEEIPVNEYVRIVFNDKSITSENYTRKDYGLIYISNGPVVYEKNIEVPDWTTIDTNVGVAQAWGLDKGVEVIIKPVNSSTVAKDVVINQSISPKTMIAKNSTITVTVSLGQIVKVPDFSKISKEEARTVTLTNAIVRYIEMYQPKTGATYGSYIWQDVKAGTNINQGSTTMLTVTVYYSLGQPYLSSLVGSSESVIPSTIYALNQDAANFTYETKVVANSAVRGSIISMSPSNQYVNPGQHIIFEISDGSLQSSTP